MRKNDSRQTLAGKATELQYQNDEMRLKAYDKAIELNPALVEAYIGRAKLVRGRDTAECTMLLNKGRRSVRDNRKI